MNNRFRRNTITVAAVLTGLLLVPAQSGLGQDRQDRPEALLIKEASFIITGTSNVRDWKIEADTMAGTVKPGPAFYRAVIPGADEQTGSAERWFENVELHIPNQALDSGISLMNNVMHQYLDSEEYPEIRYRLKETVNTSSYNDGNSLIIAAMGVLSAAGSDHEMSHEVHFSREDSGSYEISGELQLHFTDFDIEPPSYMRGALTTDDAITVNYRVTLSGQQD